jgi:DNA-binding transcriptional ArsR family regulator
MVSIDAAALEALTDIFRVLGDPTRLRLLDALSRRELCVGDLANQLGVSESAVSHQLRLLRTARLVRARRDGRMIFYSLHDTHVLTLFDQALRHVQEPAHGHDAGTAVDQPVGALPVDNANSGSRVMNRHLGLRAKPAGGGA